MIQEIEGRHDVKIRKNRLCYNCQRKFSKGEIMIGSVWKEDYIYRLYECKDCMKWIDDNNKLFNELCQDEALYEWWMKDTEPLPDFLIKL